ncbi:DUF692 domain-containing protein [Sphingomicrobium astaxanthinifaciens]|uniref:MNIO family bufferin maturase n=1 Tax=Sphingomicrobium astaxanthinifaciens TaxID=1227949 RepID=UPI001FCC93AE|nr:DUF692 domain-containing protein [Sphingomicrobium astaxanthinifaciens]MCJ7421963.1 DUF692 domain-containing protein [Sphingomicrobium astaxanthinifaciens]
MTRHRHRDRPAPSPLPPRAGIGLKPQHFAPFLEARERGQGPGWIEVHPQNYMMAGGPSHRWLGAVRAAVPVSFHSVGLSIGDPDGCDRDELERLAALCERYAPAMVSDHLSWSSLGGERLPDLLPLPMTAASLAHFVTEVGRIQDRLARPILIENPSRMVAFAEDSYDEAEFLAELVRRSGCGLLVDVNNILVARTNVGIDPHAYLDALPLEAIGEIHVAGHALERHPGGALLAIDDHGSPVSEECWALLAALLERCGPRPVLVERDNDVPAFATLAAEAARAERLLEGALSHAA